MSKVQFTVLQKPLADRLIDAACIYWDTTREALNGRTHASGGGHLATRNRAILFYLLSKDAELPYQAIADRFDVVKSAVWEGVDNVDSQQGVYRTISEQLAAIRRIAENLNAQLVTMDVRLEHFPVAKPAA